MSSWMKRFYNGAALRGGWSFRDNIGVAATDAPTLTQLARQGADIRANLASNNPADEAALQDVIVKCTNKGIPCSQDDINAIVGLISALDSLKLGITQATTSSSRQQAQVRWRLLHDAYAQYTSTASPGHYPYSKVQRVLHARDISALRQPMLRAGPYVPYDRYSFLPSVPKKWTIKRGTKKYHVPLREGTWNTLPPFPADLPPVLRTGHKWTPQRKQLVSRAMKMAYEQIRREEAAAAAAAAAAVKPESLNMEEL